MRPDELTVVNTRDMALAPVAFGKDYAFDRYEVVAGDGGANCCVRVYSVPPGKANYPYHYHETHEEIFYIISGMGTLAGEKGERPVAAGDVIVCPPNAAGAHQLRNPEGNEAPLVYIEFDTVRFPEAAHYPRSGGVGVLFADRERNAFYLEGRRVAYAEICDRG